MRSQHLSSVQPAPLDYAARLSRAAVAWRRGDFEACIGELADVPLPSDGTQRAEFVLLLARALLRVERADDALVLLRETVGTISGDDETATTRMLLGSALARAEDAERGIAVLDATAQFARERHVHATIIAEIDYYRARTYLMERQFERAREFAVLAMNAGADIVSARGAGICGWIAADEQRYTEAHGYFARAKGMLAQCRGLDIDLAASLEDGLAWLELNLRGGPGVPSLHHERYDADRHAEFIERSAAPVQRLRTLIADAWAFALDGDATLALERVWDSERLAPSPAWRVYALAERAAIARAIGELACGRRFAEEAVTLSREARFHETRNEERVGLLTLVDEVSRFDLVAANEVYEHYRDLPRPMDALLAFRHDPRMQAKEDYTFGVFLRQHGELHKGRTYLRRALRTYREIGYLWRSAQTLIELAATAAPGEQCGEHALLSASVIVTEHFPSSFLAERLGATNTIVQDPIARKLRPAERETLKLVVDGLVPRQIQEKTGRSYNTVRVYINRLLRAYGAHSREELRDRFR